MGIKTETEKDFLVLS